MKPDKLLATLRAVLLRSFSFLVAGLFIISYKISFVYKSKKEKPKQVHDLIFNTPMIRINSLSDLTGCELYGKAEFLSLTGSPKGRLAYGIVFDAEAARLIRPNEGFCLFEGTVGSTGIALATIAKLKGYECFIAMPNDTAKEKYEILLALGATVERTRPCSIADQGHYANIARERAEDFGEKGFFCNQFENPSNFKVHYSTTGPEILEQVPDIDAFVMGVGTWGFLAGVGKFLSEKNSTAKMYLADPQGSGLFNKLKYDVMYSPTEKEGKRKRSQMDSIVEGIGLNRITGTFDQVCKDGHLSDAFNFSDQEAVDVARYLMEHDGLFLGGSSCVNVAASIKLARRSPKGTQIVTVLWVL